MLEKQNNTNTIFIPYNILYDGHRRIHISVSVDR